MQDDIRLINGLDVNLSQPLPPDASPEYKLAYDIGQADKKRETKEKDLQETVKKEEKAEEETKPSAKRETSEENSQSTETPVCPLCGQPLNKVTIGDLTVYKHPDGDRCQALFASLEEIESMKKKRLLIQKAQEKEAEARKKKSIEDALVESVSVNKRINQKLEQFNSFQQWVKEKLAPSIEELKKNQENSGQEAVANFLKQNESLNQSIKAKLETVNTNLERINKGIEYQDNQEMAADEIAKTMQKMNKEITGINIAWKYTITPVTRELVADKLRDAGEDQPYHCVYEELTMLNNILENIRDFQRLINTKLAKALQDSHTDPEDLKIYQEVSAMGRQLFNFWPLKLEIQRPTGKLQHYTEEDDKDISEGKPTGY